MKHLLSTLLILHFAAIPLMYSQSVSFYGGIKPNNLKGTHFSVKADLIQRNRWLYSINYSLVKYTDSFASPNITQPSFHLENKGDRTFIDFPELKRGTIIQINDRDFRPRDLTHRFSLNVGYELLNTKHFTAKVYLGPHFTAGRSILYYIAYRDAPVIVNQGDPERIIPYHDYQVYEHWDIGAGTRAEIEYKIFKNVSIGLSSQMYFDLLGEAGDWIIGGGISYHFSK